MARQLDSVTRDALVERVRFYRDLGLTEFYRRPVDLATEAAMENPEIATRRDFTIGRALVGHVEAEGRNSRVLNNVDVFVRFLILQNGCILTKLFKTVEQDLASAYRLFESGDGHGDIGMKMLGHG